MPNGDKYRSRKKKIRSWRKGMYRQNPDGSKSTHLMQSGSGEKRHYVSPTLFPKNKKPSTDPKDWKELEGKEAFDEAHKRGEEVSYKSKRRAGKMAAGGWKKGAEGREARKDYRRTLRAEKATKRLTAKGKGDKAQKKYGYDYDKAIAAGVTPKEGKHWETRNPYTGEYFKGRKHPTVYKSKRADRKIGYKIKRAGGRLYSFEKGDKIKRKEGRLYNISK